MSDTHLREEAPRVRQATWREVPFACLIVFILTSPLAAAFFVHDRNGMFIYTTGLIAAGIYLYITGSRWLMVTLMAGVLSPVLGFITLTETLFFFGKFIRL